VDVANIDYARLAISPFLALLPRGSSRRLRHERDAGKELRQEGALQPRSLTPVRWQQRLPRQTQAL